MARRPAPGRVVLALGVGFALVGCSGAEGGSPPPAASTAPSVSAPTLSPAAGRTYLAADQQVGSDPGGPHLVAGRVLAVHGAEHTAAGLVLDVTLDLAFDGDPVAWGTGPNDRFATFTPRGGSAPDAMSFATSP